MYKNGTGRGIVGKMMRFWGCLLFFGTCASVRIDVCDDMDVAVIERACVEANIECEQNMMCRDTGSTDVCFAVGYGNSSRNYLQYGPLLGYDVRALFMEYAETLCGRSGDLNWCYYTTADYDRCKGSERDTARIQTAWVFVIAAMIGCLVCASAVITRGINTAAAFELNMS